MSVISLKAEDINNFLALIGKELPSDINCEDFLDFGQMSTHVYRAKLFKKWEEMVAAGKLKQTSIGAIIYMATLIKNKDRILQGLVNQKAKYQGSSWFKDVVNFYQTETCQYTGEAKGTKLFPVVNITSCVPNIACMFLREHLKKDRVMRSDEDLLKKFMENLFVVQMNVTADVVDKQQVWEMKFWNTIVKKSKNPDKDAYESGFQQKYFDTKKDDKYKWIVNGKEVDDVFGEAEILGWLRS